MPPKTFVWSKILIFVIFYKSVNNGRTDRRMDTSGYRDARMHLKIWFFVMRFFVRDGILSVMEDNSTLMGVVVVVVVVVVAIFTMG